MTRGMTVTEFSDTLVIIPCNYPPFWSSLTDRLVQQRCLSGPTFTKVVRQVLTQSRREFTLCNHVTQTIPE